MKFRTEIVLPPCPATLSPQSHILLAGSCFAEHIGERLEQCFPSSRLCVNPHGVLYNPASLHCLIDGLMHPERYPIGEGLFEAADGFWHHWDYSTKFTAPTAIGLLGVLHERQAAAQAVFDKTDLLFITFSTDHGYFLKNDLTGARCVANCHKQPAALFEERILNPEETFSKWDTLLKELRERLPQSHVVFTLSPYRYAKYGMHGNSLTKARLLTLIDGLCTGNPNATYFPAFEIVLDELRDYRFYDADMLHPSNQAVDYVWERFVDWCFTPELKTYGTERERLTRAMAHRPLHPESEAYERFRGELDEALARFEQKWGERIGEADSPTLP